MVTVGRRLHSARFIWRICAILVMPAAIGPLFWNGSDATEGSPSDFSPVTGNSSKLVARNDAATQIPLSLKPPRQMPVTRTERPESGNVFVTPPTGMETLIL